MINPTQEDIGRKVLYVDYTIHRNIGLRGLQIFKEEEGTLKSFNDSYVFVNYGRGDTNAGGKRENLFWLKDDGELDKPIREQLCLENEAPESYSVACFSTGHITDADKHRLEEITKYNPNLLLSTQYAFKIPIYEAMDQSPFLFMSDEFKHIMQFSIKAGYRMLEIDCDVDVDSRFPSFDW